MIDVRDLRLLVRCLQFGSLAFALILLISCGSNSTPLANNGGTPSVPGGGSSSSSTVISLIVADGMNNRVMLYTSPISTGESASIVIGQPDFNSTAPATTANGFNYPSNAIRDVAGNLWVSDWGNNRILEFKPPFTNGMAASLVLGQPTFATSDMGISNSSLALPRGMAFDRDGNLWVADAYNNRVLEFQPPFTDGMSASLVLGKTPNFGTGACGGPTRGLCEPLSLAFDGAGNLWVSDNINNRVVQFTPPFTESETPSLVIGQADLTTSTLGGGNTGLDYPWGIAFDAAGNLWVVDALNWRVLEFRAPFTNGEAASLALGYPDFTINPNPDLQSALNNPRELAFDTSGTLYVADSGNNRVMVFTAPFTMGMKASKVVGQPNLNSFGGKAGVAGLFSFVGVSVY